MGGIGIDRTAVTNAIEGLFLSSTSSNKAGLKVENTVGYT